MMAEHIKSETDVEELLNITQLSDQSLSDSDNEDIIKVVKDNLPEQPPNSVTEFHNKFGYHSLDDIIEPPTLMKKTNSLCKASPKVQQKLSYHVRIIPPENQTSNLLQNSEL